MHIPPITLAFWLLMGVSAGYIAEKRGRNPWIWFTVGAFTSLLGVAAIYWFLPEAKKDRTMKQTVTNALQETATSVVDERWTSQSWHYLNEDHSEMGPVNFDELRQLWNRGKLQSSSFVWHEGLKDWMKVNHLSGLEESLTRD